MKTLNLNDNEIQSLLECINTTIKQSGNAIMTANVLLPLVSKLTNAKEADISEGLEE